VILKLDILKLDTYEYEAIIAKIGDTKWVH